MRAFSVPLEALFGSGGPDEQRHEGIPQPDAAAVTLQARFQEMLTPHAFKVGDVIRYKPGFDMLRPEMRGAADAGHSDRHQWLSAHGAG